MNEPKYATETSVSSGRSKEEIERILGRYGADSFAYATSKDTAMVGFIAGGRQVKFTLPMPDRQSKKFTMTPAGRYRRTPVEAEKAYEQAVRQRWRALALVIKAKLEAVEAGIVTFEQEFAMHMVLPGGNTVADEVLPGIAAAYETGKVPALMGGA